MKPPIHAGVAKHASSFACIACGSPFSSKYRYTLYERDTNQVSRREPLVDVPFMHDTLKTHAITASTFLKNRCFSFPEIRKNFRSHCWTSFIGLIGFGILINADVFLF